MEHEHRWHESDLKLKYKRNASSWGVQMVTARVAVEVCRECGLLRINPNDIGYPFSLGDAVAATTGETNT